MESIVKAVLWGKKMDVSCSWIGRPNIIKMSYFPKMIYRFSTIPMKIPEVLFVEINNSEEEQSLWTITTIHQD